jgi:predicted Na+-dependent transporter
MACQQYGIVVIFLTSNAFYYAVTLVFFDMGTGAGLNALMWLQAPPKPHLPSIDTALLLLRTIALHNACARTHDCTIILVFGCHG